MEPQLFHIFRNTPIGRETFLHSIYFCHKVKASLVVYVPKFTRFLMYFENDVIQVDLDESYLSSPDTAEAHVMELIRQHRDIPFRYLEPKNFTASTLPDIPTNFDFMNCPRTISDLSSKIGLGYIGPRVRRIVNAAQFPVLISSCVFKEWKRIVVFFGGSANAVNALKLGFRISRLSGLPIDVFTYAYLKSKADYERVLMDEGLQDEMKLHVCEWRVFETGTFEENLYEVPHDALVIVGAFGHGIIQDMVFGSNVEKIQSILPNHLLIVGPKYRAIH